MRHVIDYNEPGPTAKLADWAMDPDGHLEVWGGRHAIYGTDWDIIGGHREIMCHGLAQLDFINATHVRFINPTVGPHHKRMIGGILRVLGANVEIVNANDVMLMVDVEWGDLVLRNDWAPTGADPADGPPPPQSEMVTIKANTVLGGVYIEGAENAGSFRGLDLTASTYGPVAIAAIDCSIYDSRIDMLSWASSKDVRDPICYQHVALHGSTVDHRLEGVTVRPGQLLPAGHWTDPTIPTLPECQRFSLAQVHKSGAAFIVHAPLADAPVELVFTESRQGDHPVGFKFNDGTVA